MDRMTGDVFFILDFQISDLDLTTIAYARLKYFKVCSNRLKAADKTFRGELGGSVFEYTNTLAHSADFIAISSNTSIYLVIIIAL